MFEASSYASRRSALIKALAARGVTSGLVLLVGNGESPMNYLDNTYPFRQDSSFLYFIGISQAGLAATIDVSTGEACLFGDDLTIDDIVWTGPQPDMRQLASRSGISRVRGRAELQAAVAGAAVHYFPPYRAETRAELASLLAKSPAAVDTGASLPLIRATIELRERKTAEELAELEIAVAVTVEMHRAAIATARPGMKESDVMARVAQVALSAGRLAFPPIATTKGATLHIHSYDRRLESGGLFLLDAGAESPEGYSGDLTSTFPIDPKFDERQLAIYEILLQTHALACGMIRPGLAYREVHFAAARSIVTGLKGLGIMKGDVDEAVASGAHALFFPHGLGHQMGLDVHDMENYGEVWVGYNGEPKSSQFGLRSLRLAKPLLTGMVLTVEPGIYFIPELISLWKAEGRFTDFVNYDKLGPWMAVGGIRNEEDWLVTESGGRRLGPEFPKGPKAIEEMRG
ncbi:MAG TPA: Xaa-Pro aminopeptidase [Rectinemataceae bacterium]|nr:Xaa-Pro aminopeptidase [Rectinemataceae bacterium]